MTNNDWYYKVIKWDLPHRCLLWFNKHHCHSRPRRPCFNNAPPSKGVSNSDWNEFPHVLCIHTTPINTHSKKNTYPNTNCSITLPLHSKTYNKWNKHLISPDQTKLVKNYYYHCTTTALASCSGVVVAMDLCRNGLGLRRRWFFYCGGDGRRVDRGGPEHKAAVAASDIYGVVMDIRRRASRCPDVIIGGGNNGFSWGGEVRPPIFDWKS